MDPYKQRSTLKGRITRLKNRIQEGAVNVFQAKVDLERLCQYEVDLQVHQNGILQVCSDEDHEKEEDYFENVFTEIGELKAKLSEIINTESANSVKSETVSVIPVSKPGIKLPQIQIPTFDGSIEKWATFKDLFSELVHKNDDLQSIQKFQYLKISLIDEAACLIQHLPLTSANYYIAWTILTDTYTNKYSTVTFHLKNLFNVEYQSQNRMASLKTMLTVVRTNLNALTSLGIDTESWDILIIYLLETKFDDNLYHDWVKKFDNKKLPTLNMFYDFLREMIVISERTEQKMVSKAKVNIFRETSQASLCFLCKLQHKLYECVRFKNLPLTEKNAFVNKNNICYNCLSSNQHSANKCTSKSLCKICSKKHHSILHNFSSQANYAGDEERACSGVEAQSNEQGSTFETSEDSTTVCTQMENGFKEQVLLSTAVVRVKVSTGNYHYVRALLDSGSQSCFISSQCVKKLGLEEQKMDPMSVNGIGGSSTLEINKFCECLVESRYGDYKLLIKALVIPKVTNKLPAFSLNKLSWDYTKNLNLSDPNFHTSRDIDMIIGAEHFFNLLESGFIQGPPGYPSIQNSKFGWIVAGKLRNTVTSNISSFHVNLDTTLKRFWEVEELPVTQHWTKEEKDCEEHFVQNVQRVEDGRYMVKLPFKNNIQELGESKSRAIARFRSVEKNFNLSPNKKELYVDFMEEYKDLGHMSKVSHSIDASEERPHFYLPHHSVLRESSSTTRLRVVFDGSAKSSSGVSLNDTLMVGPTIQQNIFSILLRFRKHKVLLKADCEKMYRQIWIHPENRKYQKIVWYRDNKSPTLAEYELNTLTYGTSCAPYIAVRTLKQLAEDEKTRYPTAAKITENDFFMDDLVTGANSVEEAMKIYNELVNMFQSAGFNLRKWSSNESAVLQQIPEECRDLKAEMKFDESNHMVKTLGLCWNMQSDTLYFDIKNIDTGDTLTKRRMLSEIARFYDPLGLLSPVIIMAKINIQKLWLANLNWDDEILGDFATGWKNFQSHLHCLNDIKITRNVIPFETCSRIELHGFCDASEVAYAACVYVRAISDKNEIESNLICGKSRVSPLKQISLAKLELNSGLLLAKLLHEVLSGLNIKIDSCYAWTDSMIVLDWIRQEPRTWKTFVANRVSQIHELIDPNAWYHVPSEENPADVASRGIQANLLQNNSKWWNGPIWLKNMEITFEKERGKRLSYPKESQEKRKLKSATFIIKDDFQKIELWNNISSFVTLINIIAWCLRFKNNMLQKLRNEKLRQYGLTTEEVKNAKLAIIKLVQQETFSRDIDCIKKHGVVKSDSKIKTLNPFLDNAGLLRVGGRLTNSELSDNAKHQVLLPHNHTFTDLLVRYYHEKHAHAGPSLLLAIIRQEYWIIQGLSVTKKIFHKCMSCFRANPMRGHTKQMMGDLPENRVKASPPFSTCGVDYAGPISVRRVGGRSNVLCKAYIALFVCFSFKCYHIELVSDLSTMSFIAALRRFVSRRGVPTNIYSDNGTNFVGANNLLKKFIKELTKDPKFRSYYINEQINWHFIPANSPHMGGLWESGVKAVKSSLKRSIGDQVLDFLELNTVLIEIEGVLNSRPLTPMSNDVNDLEVLTPGHFLIGRPLTAVPEPDVTSSSNNRLRRWFLTKK